MVFPKYERPINKNILKTVKNEILLGDTVKLYHLTPDI